MFYLILNVPLLNGVKLYKFESSQSVFYATGQSVCLHLAASRLYKAQYSSTNYQLTLTLLQIKSSTLVCVIVNFDDQVTT